MTFHNIFSSKKEQSIPKAQTIIIDIHEKNSLVPAELSKLNVPFRLESLKVGDYLLNNIAIERKTIVDLKSSIISKRIFSQIQNLKQYERSMIIIEGLQLEIINNEILHENAVRGFLLSLAFNYQIPFILTEDESDTAKYLFLLARKPASKEIALRPSRIPEKREEQVQFILEGFPHIGPVKAKELLVSFHSLKNIVNATEIKLEEILGRQAKEFTQLIGENLYESQEKKHYPQGAVQGRPRQEINQ